MTFGKLVRMGAAAGSLIVAAQANAADTGPYGGGGYKEGPAAYAASMWTGFYIGLNGGGAWANNKQEVDRDATGVWRYFAHRRLWRWPDWL